MSGKCFLYKLRIPVSTFPMRPAFPSPEYYVLIRLPVSLRTSSFSIGWLYLLMRPQEPAGSPKFLTPLSIHAMFSDPGSHPPDLPYRPGVAGFRNVKYVADCIFLFRGSSYFRGSMCFRECGLPYGLYSSLCTLRVTVARFHATLGRGGWLILTPQGLSPCKKRQASLAH